MDRGTFLTRRGRTLAAISRLEAMPEMRKFTVKPLKYEEKIKDDKWNANNYRKVRAPLANALEMFAMEANRTFLGIDVGLSRKLISNLIGQRLIGIWDDPAMQAGIQWAKKHSPKPDTTYSEFEDLVRYCKEKEVLK